MKKTRITFLLTTISVILLGISLGFLPKFEFEPYYEGTTIKFPTDRTIISIVLAIFILIFTAGLIWCAYYAWKGKPLKGRRGFLNGCFDLGVSLIILLLFTIFMTPVFPVISYDFVLITLMCLSAAFSIIAGIYYYYGHH